MNNRIVIANAFSINMLGDEIENIDLSFERVPISSVIHAIKESDNWMSIVGHPDTASVFGTILGVEIPANRINYTYQDRDVLYVGQYTGPRLPEGATELPEGAVIKWWRIKF